MTDRRTGAAPRGEQELADLLALAYRRGDHGEPCPPLERLAAAATGEAAAADRAAIEKHAGDCPACAAELEVAARLGLGPRAPRAVAADPAAAARIAARLTDSTHGERVAPRLTLAPRAPALHELPPPRSATSRMRWLAAALLLAATGALSASWWLARSPPPALPPPGEHAVVRGATLRLDSPLGEVDQLPERFVWSAVPETFAYELRFFAVDGEQLGVERLASPPTPAGVVSFELTGATERFEAAVRYEWQVAALAASGEILALSPRAAFRVRPEEPR